MSECSIPAQYRLRVKQRLAVVGFAREHGIKPASRHFGCARRTVRTWLRRWKAGGEAGLVPKYPRQKKRRLPAATIDLIRVARHRYIKPRRPQQNGKVERSHRIDGEEFWDLHEFTDRADAEPRLRDGERRYNHERFSLALAGRTPAEKLAAKLTLALPPSASPLSEVTA